MLYIAFMKLAYRSYANTFYMRKNSSYCINLANTETFKTVHLNVKKHDFKFQYPF